MSDKLITLVTGANQGIGYFAVQQLASSGKYHVLLGSRNSGKGQKAVQALVDDSAVSVKAENIEALEIDIDSDESINKAAENVKQKFGRLDVLVNNAGISSAPNAQTLREQYASVYNTNLFGVAVATEAFIPLLKSSTLPGGKRIIFVNSSLSSLTIATAKDSMFPGNQYPVYRSSKTALNMIMANYHAELNKEGFVVGALCPGYCATNLNYYAGFKDPRKGAKTIVDAVEAKKEDVELQLIHNDGEGETRGVYPW